MRLYQVFVLALVVGCTQITASTNSSANQDAGAFQHTISSTLRTTSGQPTQLEIVSTVKNVSSEPKQARLRACMFRPEDFQTNANLTRLEPFVSCGAVEMTVELPPGASQTLQQSFQVNSGSGSYTLSVRHLLEPEVRTSVAFAVP